LSHVIEIKQDVLSMFWCHMVLRFAQEAFPLRTSSAETKISSLIIILLARLKYRSNLEQRRTFLEKSTTKEQLEKPEVKERTTICQCREWKLMPGTPNGAFVVREDHCSAHVKLRCRKSGTKKQTPTAKFCCPRHQLLPSLSRLRERGTTSILFFVDHVSLPSQLP